MTSSYVPRLVILDWRDEVDLLAQLAALKAPLRKTHVIAHTQIPAGEHVGRIHITSGNSALGPNELLPTADLVVMDDFIYAEPRAVPEPASLSLFLLGVLLIWGFRRSAAQNVSLRRAVRSRP